MLITVQDVANILNVKKSTIYSWVNAGLIPPISALHGSLGLSTRKIEMAKRHKNFMAKS